ncbi:MAG: carbohydrate binding family 9 domain-containing protein, partial [bacterium]|nr:carbohydrate binding family 9 domain-containing protein [bacterium]
LNRWLVALLLASLGWAGDARQATVFRVIEAVRLDGVLDDDVWREAKAIGDFVQAEPHAGEPPTEATQVQLAFSEDALYIAVRCFDSAPETILATEMVRDARLYFDDSIELLLDTFHDRRNGYYFATNPAGALADGRITENSYPDMSWDGIWNVRARIDDQGWTAEFEIPFKTLAFDPGVDAWGFNISRRLARVREDSRWASPSLDVRFTQVAMAGSVDGLEDLSQGVGLDIKPNVLVGFNRDLERPDRLKTIGDGGVDIFYRITSNLVSSTTFNTDFAETEVDSRQVNLTRYPTFFPEKRAFFLEDAGVFNFGLSRVRSRRSRSGGSSRGPSMMPFFSRRIGLVGGEEVPILFGQKLTGKAGRFDIGVLNVMTRDSDVAPGRNFFVGRTKVNFWKQSYIGAIATQGEPTGETSNSLAGADMRLATSDFLGRGKNLRFTAYGAKTNTPGVNSRDMSYGGEISYPNDLLYTRYSWQEIGENFNPALGYVRREGVRISSALARVAPRPEVWNIRQLSFMFYMTSYYNTVHKQLETRYFFISPFEMELNSGQKIEYRLRPRFERLFEPFDIRDDFSIPTGDYNFLGHEFTYQSATNKPWFYEVEYQKGSFYSGHSDELSTFLLWRQSSRLSTSVELEQYWVRLREGSFNTRLAMFRVDYSFTPLIGLSNYVQYDTDSG